MSRSNGIAPACQQLGRPVGRCARSRAVVSEDMIAVYSPLCWGAARLERRAGVSSFGFSGTNAHIVLEEAPSSPAPAESPRRSAELALVSAKTEAALVRSVADLAAHLRSHPEHSLAELAYSLATAKTHHEHRLALVAGSVDELALALDAVVRGETPARSTQGRTLAAPQKVAYVFSGRGGHWLGMGRELMDSEPTFRAALETCARAIATETGWSPIDELAAPPDKSRLHRIDVLAWRTLFRRQSPRYRCQSLRSSATAIPCCARPTWRAGARSRAQR